MIVSVVEPVLQRTNPSSVPNTNIATITNQSYWICSSDQISEISTILGIASRGAWTKPRNINPRNKSSSPIGAAITIAIHNQMSEPSAWAERRMASIHGDTISWPTANDSASTKTIQTARPATVITI